jgi:trigger factor
MNVSVTPLPKSRAQLSISLPWEEWQEEIKHAAERLGKELKIPGFRAGKVPEGVIEQRLGRPALLAEAAEHAISHAYPKALADAKLDAIGRPEVTLGAVKEGEPLEITVETDVMPKAKLGSFKKAVQAVNAEFKKEALPEISKEEVSRELERLADMRAPLVTVDREAREGDTVLLDFIVKKEGVVIEGGTAKNHALVLGSHAFIPGFEEAVLGLRAGEEKTFTLSFPAEYHAEHLAGAPAEFHVTVRAVQEKVRPEINDDFAKSLGRFDTLEALQANLKTGMQEEARAKKTEERRTRILDALIESATIDYPAALVEEELGRMLREFESQTRMMGLDLQGYLNQVGKTEDELKAEWEPQAKKRLAAHLALLAVAEDMELSVDNEAVEAEMNKALAHYGSVKEAEKNLDLGRLYTAVKGQLVNQEALKALEAL